MSVAKAFKKVVVVRLSDHVGEEVHVFPDEAEAEAWLRDEADEYGVDEAGCGDLEVQANQQIAGNINTELAIPSRHMQSQLRLGGKVGDVWIK